jgi:hypothetical protein
MVRVDAAGQTVKSDGLLLFTAVIWGFAFVAQRVGMDYVGPFGFNGVRFALGCLVLLPFLCRSGLRGSRRAVRAFPASRKGAGERRIRVPVPAHDPLRAVHKECWIAANPVPEHLPHAAQRLRVHEMDQDVGSVPLACSANPLRDLQELRLDVLGILVDLLSVHLLADPRSLQERLAVGSVVKTGEHRRHNLNQNGLHFPLPVRADQAAAAPLACNSLSMASGSHPAYFCRPFTMNVG